MADPVISGTNYAIINNLLQVYGELRRLEIPRALPKIYLTSQRGGEPPKKLQQVKWLLVLFR